jgi:hypothetical protein
MKTHLQWLRPCAVIFCTILLTGCNQHNDKYSRGVGIYPGSPAEDFSPVLKPDNENYRNLAKHRPAYHSSSYDYSLTAQLITDGIITNKVPTYFSLITNEGVVAKNEREWLLDHVTGSSKEINGNNIWLEFSLGGDDSVPEINSIVINGDLTYDTKKPGGWEFKLSGSDDGSNWVMLRQSRGNGLPGIEKPDPFAKMMQTLPKDSFGKPIDPFASFWGPVDPDEPKPSFTFQFNPPEPGRTINQVFSLDKPVAYRKYRVELNTGCAKTWNIGDFDFFNKELAVEMATSHKFNSAWMSAGSEEEWVTVDLGSDSHFDHVKLYWINKATTGKIQVSDDGRTWKDIASLPETTDKVDDIALAKGINGRFVRVLMNKPESADGYILSEMEVMGTGGMIAVPKPAPQFKDNRLTLAAGDWKVQRSSLIQANGESISTPGYKCIDWVVATVPGTVLSSYLNAGAIPNPNYGDNQLMISESFFYSDFWYRNEFEVPLALNKDHIFLNFDGINWKSDVFVNGHKIGRIEGAFMRGKFDVTEYLKPGKKNVLAVLIIKNDHIGTVKEQTITSTDRNGGILGADNPTYHASVGWDWIPTIRGRNIGIWNDVFISTSGAVTIEDPFITTDLLLPDTTAADISIEATLINRDKKDVEGTLEVKFGDIAFNEHVSLKASETRTIKVNPATHAELHLKNPRLWWPKGYGQPYLYDVQITFKSGNKISDEIKFKSGIREMRFSEDNQILNIYVNGRRFIARGGNWGFPESNLAYRGREYDIAVAYHADMNFTMIRNWVAQTADDEFFEACDRHGVMVWQDFCLANPADGPDPYNPEMFIKNAEDVIKKIRNHPSIAIYVGRNEGNPPEIIDTALRTLISTLHPGIHYISNSASGVVSGGGPYRALPVKDYFLLYGRHKLHSERGMPNVMNFESLQQTLPDSALWPQNSQWGMHDYTLESAQSCASFNEMVEKAFGPTSSAREFTELAQWINYDGYRSMFEGRSKYRQGLLLWMSHPAWPSMVWQTYDYYFDPTAAYFGCKKASEAIHIQWNRVYDEVEIVNLNGKNHKGLKAVAQIFNMDGKLQWEKEKVVDSNEDTTDKIFKIEFPASLSSVHFIKLTLTDGKKVISENFYWRGLEDGNLKALRSLPKIDLNNHTKIVKSGNQWVIVTTFKNESGQPALMIRLKVVGKKTGERMLPVFFSDNYFSLMPGEEKEITMKLKDEDTRGEKPEIVITGFNLL